MNRCPTQPGAIALGRSPEDGAGRRTRGPSIRNIGSLLCALALAACGAPQRSTHADPPPASGFIRPATGLTIAPFDATKNKGIDIAGRLGDPVVASADGRVVYADSRLRGYGLMIIIKHNNSYLTAYGHNNRLLVKEGDVVRAGQRIAEMGSTDANQPELHFEIRVAGQPVDPERYLRAGDPASAAASSAAAKPRLFTGSGIAIARSEVITNAHVVDGCKTVTVVDRGPARVKASDPKNDLALLELDAVMVPTARVSQTRLRQGDPITVIGYPLHGLLAEGPQVTAGNATALAGLANNTALIQISAPVQPGNSGGPVLDASGNVVGVVESKLNALRAAAITGDIAQNINFAVSPGTLRGFLEANRVDFEEAASTRNLGTADVAEIGRRFTVLVECTK